MNETTEPIVKKDAADRQPENPPVARNDECHGARWDCPLVRAGKPCVEGECDHSEKTAGN